MAETTTQEVDLDAISMEELRDLANKNASELPVEDPLPERDDQGRFTKPEVKVEDKVEDEEDEPVTIYKREIDLGDGAGVQVFSADSVEALLDQLTEAQRNATKKIREQATKLKEFETAKKAEEQQFDADKEFVYSQEMMTHPTQAMKKMFHDITGYDITEFKSVAERVTAWEASQTQAAEAARIEQEQTVATSEFMKAHPEYVPNENNGKRLVREVKALEGEARAANKKINYSDLLTKAFSSLNEDGLLTLKAPEDVTTVEDNTEAERARIAASVEVVQPQRRKASGLSARGRVAAPPKITELTEEELYKMPLDKLAELANKSS